MSSNKFKMSYFCMTNGENMIYNELLTYLQNLTNKKITQIDLSEILGISQAAISKRITRNSEFSSKEIALIKEKLNIADKEECIRIKYYSDIYASCGFGTLAQSENCEVISVPKKLYLRKLIHTKIICYKCLRKFNVAIY